MIVQERYSANSVAANGTFPLPGSALAGFICVTSGTLTVTMTNGTVLVNALPVTAGAYHPLPIHMHQAGGTLTLAGGASGTVLT